MITTPKHFNVSFVSVLRTIARHRKTFFYNGTLCLVNLDRLTIDHIGQKTVKHFGTLLQLANYVRTQKEPMLSERVTELYLKYAASPREFKAA